MDVFLVKFLFLSAVILLSWGGLKCELRWEPSAEQHQPLLTAATALTSGQSSPLTPLQRDLSE